MQATNPRPGLSMRVGAVTVLLGGLFAGVYAWQSTQAQVPTFQPLVMAYFPKDQLEVAVALPKNFGWGAKPGNLTVELVNGKGDVLAREEKANARRLFPTSVRFVLAADRKKADRANLRVLFRDQKFEIALAQALLQKPHETTITAGQQYTPGAAGALTCTVQGVKSLAESVPHIGAEVAVHLKDKDGKRTYVASGQTQATGTLNFQFDMPEVEPGQYTLEVVTKSVFGEEKLERAVTLKSDAKILLVSDKPIYQPGQLMHIRALVLRPADMKPVASKDLLFEVEDSKGNKVYKKTLKTSEFGIASVDFQLADEVNMGDYHLRANVGEHHAVKTVNVKRYVLPKFKVDVKADKSFYLPKEKIAVELQSDYFFGKPVSKAKVEVTASTFDVQFRQFHKWTGTTDEQGHAKFDVQLPDYFVGQPLQQGNALVKLDVKVLDSADHTENVTKTYTVSDQSLRVNLIPEAGKLVPGLDNRIFAAATYPDGSPAANCEIKVFHGQALNNLGAAKDPKQPRDVLLATLRTNAAGLAEFRMTPKVEQFTQGNFGPRNIEMLGGMQQHWSPTNTLNVRVEAGDARGNKALQNISLNSQPFGENVLLRLDKAIYQGGDMLDIDIRTSAGLPTVYLDIVRGGQIVLNKWYDVKDGQAKQRLVLPLNVFGSLEIHAYQMLAHGEIIRDSRVVYVQSRDDLKIDVQADNKEYLPGAGGKLRFQVTDSKGKPTAAALGVIIVDEAVYAMQELQPGLEKVYFTLQEELLKPQVQLKFSPGETIDGLVLQPAPRQQVAEVLLTAVKLPVPQRWTVDPVQERRQRLEGQVQQIGGALFNYAWNTSDNYLTFDKEAKTWVFRADLLADLVKANQLPPQALEGPFGGKLTFADLASLEKTFTVDALAHTVTIHRLHHVVANIFQHTNNLQAKYLVNKAWVLPSTIIDDMAKAQKYDPRMLKDAWGEPFQLIKRQRKNEGFYGQQFDSYEIVSKGPDRRLGSDDDVTMAQTAPIHQFGGMTDGWWLDERLQASRHAKRQEQFRHIRFRGLDLMDRAKGNEMFLPRGGAGGQLVPLAMPIPEAKKADVQKAQAADQYGSAVQTTPAAGGGAAAPITRVREYFPETMLWQPALITDDAGKADLAVNFADSITTWRLSASANSRGGALGGVNVPLKVFQDFFVDVDLPVSLTQDDEITIPVAVYNYLKTPQVVRIELQNEPWFQLLDAPDPHGIKKSELRGTLYNHVLQVKSGDVTNVTYRIKAKKLGYQPITIKAHGTKMSDAVKRVVEVVPNGQKFEKVVTDRLAGNINQTLTIPANAIDDASKVMVRLYPGVLSQVVDGLDGMMRMPNGCFEQTSSSAYPNVLIVDYLKKNRVSSPKMMMQAEQYLNLGYQRLLTFERPGGGFDWWGHGEPLVWLSAYGLQEFSDMSKVYPIDRKIIDRTQQFLLRKMDKDGTWSNIGATHGETIASMGDARMLLTSYVAWSLLDSGLPKDQLKKTIDYIRGNVKNNDGNAYILALAANALAAYDAKDDSTLDVLQKLDKLHQDVPEWKAIQFPAKTTALTYARGDSVTVETTALAAIAMVRTGQFTGSVNRALTYLVKAKQGNGTWGSTSATILSLKALLAGMGGSPVKGVIPFTITVNGKEAAKGTVNEDNGDMMQSFDLKEFTRTGANEIGIQVQGETGLMYQIVARHFEPWQKDKAEKKPIIDVDVAYDRTRLSTNDLLRAKATLKYSGTIPTFNVILDLGIPPGFTVDGGEFAEMVGKKTVQKFSVTGRQVVLYLGDVKPGDVLTFEYTLKPKYPLRARTPASVAYEYYTPTNRAETRPVELVVEDRK